MIHFLSIRVYDTQLSLPFLLCLSLVSSIQYHSVSANLDHDAAIQEQQPGTMGGGIVLGLEVTASTGVG